MTTTGVEMESPSSDPSGTAWFVRLTDSITTLTGAVSVVALLFMTTIVCLEVVFRFLLNQSIFWVTEIATYVLVGMTFLALASAQRAGSHISVELIVGTLNGPMRQRVEQVVDWIGLTFVTIAAWQMFSFNVQEFINGTRDWGLLSTLQWKPQVPVTIGLITFFLALLADIQKNSVVKSNGRLLAALLLFALLAAALWALGPYLVKIEGLRFDQGSILVALTLVVCSLLISGARVAAPFAAILLGLISLFWLVQNAGLGAQGLVLVGALIFLMLAGAKIAVSLGLAGLLGLYFFLPQPQLLLVAERSWGSVNTFTLTAVPMFVLMGGLLVKSGVTTQMFDALSKWFGRTPGGIAHASVAASSVFAAVSGSSLATAATMGKVACPDMLARGYSARLTYGIIAAGGTLGILIPPSIAMIIYGTTVGANVSELFMAGIVPGLLLTAAFMGGVFIWSVLYPQAAPRGDAYTFREKLSSLIGVLPFLFVIIAVLGSLYAGIATPTEAGAVGAAIAFLLCVQRRQLSLRSLYEVSLDTVRVTAFLLLIVVSASILSWVFDYLRIPNTMVEAVLSADLAPWMVLAVIAVAYIILGMFIDPISMMLMTLPVTFPIVMALGHDPIWFGITLVLLIEVGLITPPVGILLFVLRGMSDNVPLKEIVFGVLPFVLIILGFLVFLYAFPEVVHWLPNRMQ